MKRTEVLGVRLLPTELEALKSLAQKEARSPAGWLRFRVRQEAERWGLPVMPETRPSEAQLLGVRP